MLGFGSKVPAVRKEGAMTVSKRSLGAAVLLTIFLSSANMVVSQSSLNDEDNISVVKAVLEAELARQVSTFENVRQLSTENITVSIPMKVAADLKLIPISLAEITGKAYSYTGAHYLRFNSFKIEDSRAVVTLSVVSEVSPCFGPHQENLRNFTYRLAKLDGYWKAELIHNSPPGFTFRLEKLPFGKSL